MELFFLRMAPLFNYNLITFLIMGLRNVIPVRRVLCIFIFHVITTISFKGFSQEKDFGSWVDVDVSHKSDKFMFGLLGEFYTKSQNKSVDRVSIGAKGDYFLSPALVLGTGYLLMDYSKENLKELRNRVYVQIELKKYLSNWHFSLRERMQLTLYPETKEKELNAFLYWRNRIKVEYQCTNFKIEPVFDIESFCLANKGRLNGIDEYRYSLGLNYKLSTKHKIKFYGLISNTYKAKFYALGLDYSLKL